MALKCPSLIRCLIINILISSATNSASHDSTNEDCTDLVRDQTTLLVFSTLGGGLTALDPITSETRWQIADEPPVSRSPEHSSLQYLPNPKDGSLYKMGGINGGLKKLPYTIPQLVASSPCRSSDGILFSGRKSDTWFMIDPVTGRREEVLGFGESPGKPDSIGWATSRAVYLGRTQYTVLMYDSLSKDQNSKSYNITFYDYSSHTMAPEVSSEYEWMHLTSSNSGSTVTLNRKGKFLWQKDVSSPVVATFLLGPEGLLSVPFTTVSDTALANIIEYAKDGNNADVRLFQSLYVGEHSNSLYAIPSLVGIDTPTISSEPLIRLLEGPGKGDKRPSKQKSGDGGAVVHLNELFDDSNDKQNSNKNQNIIVLGHYQMPKVDTEYLKISPTTHYSGSGFNSNRELATIINRLGQKEDNESPTEPTLVFQGEQKSSIETDSDAAGNSTFEQISQKNESTYRQLTAWMTQQENKALLLLLTVLISMVIALFFYIRFTFKELQSQNGSKTRLVSGSTNSSGGSDYQELEIFEDGEVRVGKICFDPREVLGKGCEGTFVFKGTFEARQVAVKRILPECFTLADREVSLLRESDAHANVVRYFCTEQDRQFRYIALELCAATLQDFTEGDRVEEFQQQINKADVLFQATNGLKHLHSLSIVHRDIKPQNVLLSMPDPHQSMRVMISDFGLCKKLNVGKNSFSRRSGVTGTEGWIAPEMLRGQRTTTSVDIFSLGCVFYYVMTGGHHPFGDSLKRQANILANDYDLHHLNKTGTLKISKISAKTTAVGCIDILAEEVIKDMINKEPGRRPTAKAILSHPLFWSDKRILAFLQDVSDRVEKAELLAEPLWTLERNAKFIVRDDFNQHLDPELTNDLKKYRGYQGFSVRDLLRALRNKKHHYHELSYEAQKVLGPIPEQFTHYWIDRFPRLLSHSYHVLQSCSEEALFRPYYDIQYIFTKPDYLFSPQNDNMELLKYYEQTKMLQRFSPKQQFPNRNNGGDGKQNTRRGCYNFNNKSVDINGGENEENTPSSSNDNVDNEGFIRPQNRNKNTWKKNQNYNNKNRESNLVWTLPSKATAETGDKIAK